MSVASERKQMRELLPAYSLMSVPELGKFLGASEEIAREMVDQKAIPSVQVGKRRMVDPMDAAVYVLAERAGISVEEFWAEHGDYAVDLAKRHVARIRRFVA